MKPTPKPSDALAMHSETPHILQKKSGEPGGEKARVAKELFDSLSDHAPIPTVLLNQEQFTRAVAGALAACALAEAKWWKLQIESRIHGINFYQHKNFEIATKIETERIERLERAAEGKT